jgi:hypothetical protein
MYMVISKPKRKSVAAGVVQVMFISDLIRLLLGLTGCPALMKIVPV